MSKNKEIVKEIFRKYYYEHHSSMALEDEFVKALESNTVELKVSDVMNLLDTRLQELKVAPESKQINLSIQHRLDEVFNIKFALMKLIEKNKTPPPDEL